MIWADSLELTYDEKDLDFSLRIKTHPLYQIELAPLKHNHLFLFNHGIQKCKVFFLII